MRDEVRMERSQRRMEEAADGSTAPRQRYTSSEAAGAFLGRGGLQGYEGEVEKESSLSGPIDTCFSTQGIGCSLEAIACRGCCRVQNPHKLRDGKACALESAG
jgi:hypothetical protein